MVSFIESVLIDLRDKKLNFEDLQFILPSKRAGIFLKHQLAGLIDKPIFSPEIKSIEEFVEELSGLKVLSNIDLLFSLYSTYKSITRDGEVEPFESFSKWAQILLQDFNEIDRHLVEQNQIFDYLTAIVELNHWSKEENQTDLIKIHLKFWHKLKEYYSKFTENLLNSKFGYQGLIYREACDNLEVYIENKPSKTHVFLGFNALNRAESIIIQGLLENNLAHIYWDVDETFINDPIHDAGLFFRHHKNSWNYFKKAPFNWLHNNYKESKKIKVIGVPKLIGQAKYIGQILEGLQIKNKTLSDIAIVLGEENLLMPVLNSLPKSIEKLNVTMGLALKYVPLASAFDALFTIHKKEASSYYHKDVARILSHPSFYQLFETASGNTANDILKHIQTNNLTYLSTLKLKEISKGNTDLISLFFDSWENSPAKALKKCSEIIFEIKSVIDKEKKRNGLELEYLYKFNTLFNQLKALNDNHKHLISVAALNPIYRELLSSESIDFRGEPLEGLQIMGVLESRVLDFETVIISSVNEGVLPAGKSNNSFIPFDVKIENGLPTFKEKDAVYTYHFYHLLQRANNVYILYNTESDALNGGEKSRFVTQLEIEGIHNIEHFIASPHVPKIENKLLEIPKTDMVIREVHAFATKGFSPSSLSNYIRNPIDFYYQKILGIKEFEDVEENIAFNTLGSVIHETLKDFYDPIINQYLTLDYLDSLFALIEATVTKHFKLLYKEGDFTKGKNLIIFNIAQHYIKTFIEDEKESLKTGNKIKIKAIEIESSIDIQVDGYVFPVKLKGTVDRVDEFNGVTRIIDYKTGKVDQGKVEIVEWSDITSDYDKYSKSFQILCYAYMLHKQNVIELPVEAGIISFKNLKKGFLKFGTKSSAKSRTKNQEITFETLSKFEVELKKLISEICNPKLNFVEKELNQ